MYLPFKRVSKRWSERQELSRTEVVLYLTGGLVELDILTNHKDLGLLESSKKTFSANVNRQDQVQKRLGEETSQFSSVSDRRWAQAVTMVFCLSKERSARVPGGLSL